MTITQVWSICPQRHLHNRKLYTRYLQTHQFSNLQTHNLPTTYILPVCVSFVYSIKSVGWLVVVGLRLVTPFIHSN